MCFKDPMEADYYYEPCQECGCEIQAGDYKYEIFDSFNQPKLVCEECLRDYLRDIAGSWSASEIADIFDLDKSLVVDPKDRMNSIYYQEEE